METSNFSCISISVQTFQYAPKTLYIYVLFTWYLYKTKALLFKYILWVLGFGVFLGLSGFFWRLDKDFPSSPSMES